MKYTIVGAITKYKIEDIKPYVESINSCGFLGEKLMLVYDIEQDVIEYLENSGWLIAESSLYEHIILQRFIDIYSLLNEYETDVVIWTDVKDVIFQNNPIPWLEKNMKKDILALSESIIFKTDSWAVVNAGSSFPLEWLWLQDKISYCAGTIIGRKEAIKDLFIEIYRWSKTTANPEQLSDQAAYNILIHLYHFKNIVQCVNQEEGLATQLGTVLIKKDIFKNTLLEPTPLILEDYTITNQQSEPFCIVHQYDRDTNLKSKIIKKYVK